MTKAKVVEVDREKVRVRTLFDVIPLRPEWVGGSTVVLTSSPCAAGSAWMQGAGSEQPMGFVRDAILQSLFDAD